VSRRHVEFVVKPGSGVADRIEVRDLGSTNGMLVDGHRITQTAVHDGTQVKIGNTTMTVRVIEEDTDV
jgi:pSer/pThr/pTyr-binding forkhead associated (FHA) protein